MMIRHAVAAFGVLAGAALVAPAQPAPTTPAPTPTATALSAAATAARGATVANVVPSTFRMQLVVGNRFKQTVKNTKGTDALIPQYRAHNLSSFAAYLKHEGGSKLVTVKGPDGGEEKVEAAKEYPDDEKRDVYAKDVRDFATALNADNVPLGLAPTTSPFIAAFGVDEGTQVTVLIYNRLRMVQRWELKMDDITDQKIAEILNATEEMITGKKK